MCNRSVTEKLNENIPKIHNQILTIQNKYYILGANSRSRANHYIRYAIM